MSHNKITYHLSDGVYISLFENMVIFLDLNKDRYSALTPPETASILPFLSVHKDVLHPSAVSALRKARVTPLMAGNAQTQDGEALAQHLVDEGLLTSNPTGKPARPISLPMPSEDLSGYDFDRTPKIRAGHVFNFFRATISAYAALRFMSTKKVVTSVSQRRKQSRKKSTGSQNDARDLMEIFKILRPLFFTSQNHCFFDSLSLLKFMELHGVYPNWVFGVKLRPFGAHCWVQDDDFVYNDSLQHVRAFSPIMSA